MTNHDTIAINNFEKRLLLIFSLLVLSVYLLTPTKNFYWDGIYFSQVIEDAPTLDKSLLQPNHLFYNIIGYLAYRAAQLFGLQIRAVFILQFISSVFGVAGAVVLFKVLRWFLQSTYLSFALTLLFAFSATWWKFSTDAASYVPSVFFLLLGFYFLLPGQPPRPLLVALAHSSAMLLHQLAIFFFPVVVLGLLFQAASSTGRDKFFLVLQYSVAAFLLTFGTFCLCFYLLAGTFDLPLFFHWITWYSPDIGFGTNASNSFFLTLRGHARLFFDGRFNFLARSPLMISLAVLLGAALVFLIAKCGRSLREIKEVVRKGFESDFLFNPLTLLCTMWIVPYLIFLFFFIPGNTFYRLFYFPALILLFGVLLSLGRTLGQWRLGLLAVVIFLANFLFFIHPYSRVRENTPLSLAFDANRSWSDKTVIYYDTLNSDDQLVKYFNPATRWKALNFATIEEFETELKNVYQNGGTVWLNTSAVERMKSKPQMDDWFAANSTGTAFYELADKTYNIRFVQLAPQFLKQ